jgi:ribose/xylose/arabinose/galactoside ABC-type transport system permease subunit
MQFRFLPLLPLLLPLQELTLVLKYGCSLGIDAIAAVVIGGASLNGGKGNAVNTLMGVLILGLIGTF